MGRGTTMLRPHLLWCSTAPAAAPVPAVAVALWTLAWVSPEVLTLRGIRGVGLAVARMSR